MSGERGGEKKPRKGGILKKRRIPNERRDKIATLSSGKKTDKGRIPCLREKGSKNPQG